MTQCQQFTGGHNLNDCSTLPGVLPDECRTMPRVADPYTETTVKGHV